MSQREYSYNLKVSADPTTFQPVNYEPGKPIKSGDGEPQMFHISMFVIATNRGAFSEYIYCSFPAPSPDKRVHEYLQQVVVINDPNGQPPVNSPVLKFNGNVLHVGLNTTTTLKEVRITVTRLV